jgi:hypothetical protein
VRSEDKGSDARHLLRRVCVYCGSNVGSRALYASSAERFGRLLVEQEVELVYGGGQVGLMGILADAVLAAGGRVHGVIPRALAIREVAHAGLTELYEVETMHERKALMAELSDGFVALPGGLGTLEELFEIATWAQLGMHAKPCGLLDVAGYFSPLATLLDHMVAEGFLRAEHRRILLTDDDPSRLLERMRTTPPPRVIKWLELEQA